MDYAEELQLISSVSTKNSGLFPVFYLGLLEGPLVAVEYGVHEDPPFPEEVSLGTLFHFLNEMTEPDLEGPRRVILHIAASEALVGMFWLIKLEWNSRFKFPFHKELKGKRLLKQVHEPYGHWLQSVLHMCEKVATFNGGRGHAENCNAFKWFHRIVKELVLEGGLQWELFRLYSQGVSELAAQNGKANHKEYNCRKLKRICGSIEDKNPPTTVDSHFAKLLQDAVVLADKSDVFQKGAFNSFTSATRNYIQHLQSKDCQAIRLRFDERGSPKFDVSLGQGRGKTLFEI